MFYFEILDLGIFFYWNVNTIIVVDQTCEAVLNTSFIAILKNKLLFSPKLSVKVIGWADIRRRWTEESAETGILYAGGGGGEGWLNYFRQRRFCFDRCLFAEKKIYLQQWSLPLPDYLVSNIPLDFYARIKLHAWLFLQPLLIQIPIGLPVRRTTS